MNKPTLCLLAILTFGISSELGAQSDRGREIMEALEAAPSPRDQVSDIKMVMTDQRGGTRERTLRQASRKEPEASLTVFLAPGDVKGSGLLGIKSGQADDQWLYLPALKRSRRIAAGSKGDSFMGSEFSFEDLQGYALEDWTYRHLGQESIDGVLCEKVEALPLKSSVYLRRILWIDTMVQLPRQVHFYGSGTGPEKIMTLKDLAKEGEGWFAQEISMENLRTGKATLLTITRRKTNQGLADGVFTLGTLESGRLP